MNGDNKAICQKLSSEMIDRSGSGKFALATVVRVFGSAYKKEGAKMLVDQDGHMIGSISGGGCLEPDVVEFSKQVIENKQPIIKHYNMDEDLMWGLGLGCPGSVDIFIEPVMMELSSLSDDPFFRWVDIVKDENFAILCKVVNTSSELQGNVGRHMLLDEKGLKQSEFDDSELQQLVVSKAAEKIAQTFPVSETIKFNMSNGEWADVFIDVQTYSPELLIFGAGDGAIPLASLGSKLGFKTTIVDARPAYATMARFPDAHIILSQTNQLKQKVSINKRTYVVIMNHHLEKDEDCLRFALNSEAPYVGALGPRRRCKKILAAIKNKGMTLNHHQLEKLYNPIGLNIGAQSSEEIAVSIISEILAIRHGHPGGFLREDEKIHQQSAVNK